MTGTTRVPDVMSLALERTFGFIDYEPRDVPGFQSDIAVVFNCSSNQTENLLRAVDAIASDPHFEVRKEELAPPTSATKGKVYPKRIRVTVSRA